MNNKNIFLFKNTARVDKLGLAMIKSYLLFIPSKIRLINRIDLYHEI